jgi:hypothetical protein
MSNLYQKQVFSSGLKPDSKGQRFGRFYFMLGILSLLGILSVKVSFGQISVPNTSTINQNFDGMGATATASLPANWKMSPAGGGITATWGNAGNFTAVTQGASSGTPTSGGRYNWGNSVTTTDRALGVMTSGGYTSPNAIMAHFRNTNAGTLQTLTIGYTLERYRINTAAASVAFSYSLDGSAWTAVSGGDIASSSLPTGTNAYNFNPSGTPSSTVAGIISLSSISITGLSIPNNGDFYLRWNLNTTGGNSQGIGIDNFSIAATFGVATPSFSFTPTSITGMSGTFGSPGNVSTTTISGSSLSPASGSITVNAPANFEVSNDGTTWGSSAAFAYTGGNTFSPNTVSFRFTNTAPGGPLSGSATSSGGGVASPPSVSLSGTNTGPTAGATPTSITEKFYANHTFPSQARSFSVSGSNLVANLVVTAPAGYELSTDPAFGSASNPLSFTPVAGTVSSTLVYVRLTGATVGTFNGNITVTSTSASTINVSISNGQVYAAPVAFTPGNLVATVVGETGAGALSAAASPVFLREYTPAGSLVQSILAPVSVQGANQPLTQSGTSTLEGYMNLSPDGKFLTLTGYAAHPQVTTGVALTPSATTPRLIARVDYQGNFNTSTQMNDGFTGSNIRSAVTVDGNSFWTAGAGGTGATGGGVRYSTVGSSTSVQVSSGNNGNTRVANIANGRLFVSSGAGTQGVQRVGVGGLPTTSGNSNNLVATISGNNPSAFKFLDRDPIAPGIDVMYVASSGLFGIQKFSSSNEGDTWTARGTYNNGVLYRDISLEVVGTDVVITAVRGDNNNNTIVRFTDVSAWDAAINVPVAESTIVPAVGTDVFLKGISVVPILVNTPDIAISQNSIPAGNVAQGSVANPIYSVQLDVSNANSVLTAFNLTTGGTYVPADLVNLSLRISADATLDAGDPTISTTSTIPATGNVLSFNGLSQAINNGQTRYLFVTAEVSGCATIGNTITLTSSVANVSFANANKSGTIAAGNSFTVSLGTVSNPSGVTAPGAAPTLSATWTNPACSDEVIVFISTSPISGTPPAPGSLPVAGNLNYTLAPPVAGFGSMVYRGTASPQIITGLTVGTTYYVRFYNRVGTNYSSGTGYSYVPQFIGLFSRASGDHDAAIWALTPTGTPATAASLGGFNSTTSIIIQPGHTVNLTSSGVSVRDIVVQSGGTLRRSQADYAVAGLPGNMAYFNLSGNINCNGTIGNGNLFNPIGINLAATSSTIFGTGTMNIGRIRRNTTGTGSLIIQGNVNVTFPGGAAVYVNNDDSRLEITIGNNRSLNITDPTGDLSFDGVDGASAGNRSGSVSVQSGGNLFVGGTFFLFNNNTAALPSFDKSTSISIQASGSATIGNLTFDGVSGQSSTASLNGLLNITGSLLVNGGTLNTGGNIRLRSSAAGTARIANSAGAISGLITAERYVPTSGWHLTGTTLSGQTISDWNDDLSTYGSMPGVETPNQGYFTSSIFEYDQTDNASIPYSNETTKGWIVPGTSALVAGKGYRVWIPGGSTLDNTGTYSLNPASIPVTNSGSGLYPGFNLIMNPHLSAINVSGINFGAAQNCVVIWNPQSNAYEYTGSSPISGVTLNNSITPIASGQAFFVYTPSNTSITIPQTAKSSSSGTFFRTSTQGTGVEIQLTSTDGARDAALFQFIADASETYEPALDAIKFRNPGMNVYSINPDNQKLAINGLPFAGEQMIMPLGYSVAASGTYKLGIANLENLQADAQVFLKDNETGSIFALNQNPEITFTTAATAGNDQRFELIFTQSVTGSPVPVVKADVQIFPNPATGSFTLAYAGLEGTSELEIRDMLGRLVSRSTIGATLSEVKLNCPEVSGRYFIHIRNEKAGEIVKSLVVR